MASCERGSTTVEVAISGAALSLIISGLLTSAYVGFAHIWIKHSSYEAAICLATKENEAKCREQLEENINGVLLGEPLRNVRLDLFAKKVHVRFKVDLLGGVSANEERTLALPLRRKKESEDAPQDFQI